MVHRLVNTLQDSPQQALVQKLTAPNLHVPSANPRGHSLGCVRVKRQGRKTYRTDRPCAVLVAVAFQRMRGRVISGQGRGACCCRCLPCVMRVVRSVNASQSGLAAYHLRAHTWYLSTAPRQCAYHVESWQSSGSEMVEECEKPVDMHVC